MGHDNSQLMFIRVSPYPCVVEPIIFVPSTAMKQVQHLPWRFGPIIRKDDIHRVVEQKFLRAEIDMHSALAMFL